MPPSGELLSSDVAVKLGGVSLYICETNVSSKCGKFDNAGNGEDQKSEEKNFGP